MKIHLGRWPRRLLIALAIVVALLVVIRLVLDPIATHFTRKGLNDAEGIRGDFARVHVTVFPPGYEIHRIKIIEDPGGSWRNPLFYAERVDVRADWHQLFRARLSARVRLDDPKIVVTKRKAAKDEKKKAAQPDVEAALKKVIPAQVSRIEVRNGEFLYRDLTAPRDPEVWVHDLELAVENLATREELAHGRPAIASAHAKLGRSGDITFFASVNPFKKKPEAAGELALRGWKVAELYDLVQPATKLQTPKGTLDLFTEFKIDNGLITGGVKPVLKNVEIRPTEDNFGNKLKAWLADTGLELFSDRVPDRNAVATVIPIKGKLEGPDIQLWPTILGVLRNAFVEGISGGFANLPPPTAEKKQGVLKQAAEALDKDEGPPKAQPVKPEKGDGKK
jgi:hypothetical protein